MSSMPNRHLSRQLPIYVQVLDQFSYSFSKKIPTRAQTKRQQVKHIKFSTLRKRKLNIFDVVHGILTSNQRRTHNNSK